MAMFVLLAIPSTALTQDRSPELQRLDYFVGEWTIDAGDVGTGEMACEWLGARVLTCNAEFTYASGATVNSAEVWRHNQERGFYTWLRYWGNGLLDDHIGWVEGNTWTWSQRDSAGGLYRFIMIEEAPTGMSMRMEQSVRGGDWQHVGNATLAKVR
jgi:hypothetical protein